MAPRKPSEDRSAPPIVRYAPLGELKVDEISEAELEKLESGPPGQVHLNFALALRPAALTVFITIQTVEIKNDRVYHAYWIAFWLLSEFVKISNSRFQIADFRFATHCNTKDCVHQESGIRYQESIFSQALSPGACIVRPMVDDRGIVEVAGAGYSIANAGKARHSGTSQQRSRTA